MYRVSATTALLFLGILTLSAQNRSLGTASPSTLGAPDHSPASTTILEFPVNSPPVCPVDMHARHDVWDHTITIQHGEEQFKGPFGQRIVLTLTDANARKIVAGTVLVRGFNGKNRMLDTGSAEGNATKTLRTGFTELTKDSFSADLYISGFTAVTFVKLQDLTYSDGSIRRFDRSNSCRIAPDPLMLVAGH